MLGKIEGRRRTGRQRIDGWMASPTWQTWVWASSGSWWWTAMPGKLQLMGSQRAGHDWATELNWMLTYFTLREAAVPAYMCMSGLVSHIKKISRNPYFRWIIHSAILCGLLTCWITQIITKLGLANSWPIYSFQSLQWTLVALDFCRQILNHCHAFRHQHLYLKMT